MPLDQADANRKINATAWATACARWLPALKGCAYTGGEPCRCREKTAIAWELGGK